MLDPIGSLKLAKRFAANFGWGQLGPAAVANVLHRDIAVRVGGVTFTSNWDRFAFWHLSHSWVKLDRMALFAVERCGRSAPVTFLDVGAHFGAMSVLMALRFPNAAIYAFEPSRLCLKYLRRNCAQLPSVAISPLAVGDGTGTLAFYEALSASQTSSVQRSAVPDHETVEQYEVESTTLAVVLDALDLTDRTVIVKVDVQGYEAAVVRGLGKYLDRVDLLFLESTWSDASSIEVGCEMTKRFDRHRVLNDVKLGADVAFWRE